MITMSLINLLMSLTVGIAAFWTYANSNTEPPTKEIVCACSIGIILLSFVWFVVNAPWFLNLALLIFLMVLTK